MLDRLLMFNGKHGYVILACWVTALGALFIAAPANWFGPSWSYFSQHGSLEHGTLWMPAGGFGMGVCLFGIGLVQITMILSKHTKWLPLFFFLAGFVFWVAGILIIAEGLLGHQGLIEGPLLMYCGVHKFISYANLIADRKRHKVNAL